MGPESDHYSADGATKNGRTENESEANAGSEQMIGSLGNALAGVSLNQTGSFGYEGSSSEAGSSTAAFASTNGAQYSNGNGNDGGGLAWGASALSGVEGSGFPGTNSMPGLGGNAAPPSQNGEVPASSGLLTGSGTTTSSSYNGDHPEQQRESDGNNNLFHTAEPTTPLRKESLELFLSQSPSKTLGGDLLQLNNGGGQAGNGTEKQSLPRSGSAYSLEEVGRAPGSISSKFSVSGMTASSSGELRESSFRRKAESPSCSVTATSASSRSASPYASIHEGDGVRKIQAFPGTELPGSSARPFAQQATAEVNRMNSASRGGYVAENQDYRQSNMHQPNNLDYGNAYGQSMEPMPQGGRHGQQQPVAANAPQVLYMAVPTPDGRGQMLQPVQMVQIQGQGSQYVIPQGAGGAAQPSMMVLPTQNVASDMAGGSPGSNWQGQQYSQSGIRESGYGQYSGRSSNDDYMVRRNDSFSNQRNSSLVPGDAISSIYAAPQRPPLDELLGNVRRLSRDQVGCRLLQQALDEEGPMAATMILNEGISFWGEAMVDPFGNYLFQKILEKITKKERAMLIKTVSARLVNASLNLHGTRSVQKVVEMCALDEADPSPGAEGEESSTDILTRALTPAAARLCIDSHGNHVIQRILLKLGHHHATFVFDAVAASVGDVARHRHGCCVIQRCLDSPPSEARGHLVHRIVDKSLDLMQDAYGNYVVQYVLDVCDDSDVHAVCESVVGRVSLLAIQKFSSNVMEKCLERCTDRVKECYLQELSDPERIRELMMDPFGNYVVQRALSVATHAQAVRLVEAMRPHLISSQPAAPYGQRGVSGGMRNTAGGRRIMAKICRRFPNFTLSEVATPEELYSQNKGHLRSHRAPQVHQQSHSAMPPGLGQQVQYGDPQRGRHYAEQADLYYEAAPPGYYDHMRGQATYPQM